MKVTYHYKLFATEYFRLHQVSGAFCIRDFRAAQRTCIVFQLLDSPGIAFVEQTAWCPKA